MADVAATRPLIPRLSSLARFTFVDVIIWCLRIAVVAVVVGGTIGTLIKGRYAAAQWLDLLMFGLTIGSVYALIALGYTMVYGVLRLINFAHGDLMMTGSFAGYFVATSLDRSGFLNQSPLLAVSLILRSACRFSWSKPSAAFSGPASAPIRIPSGRRSR
jgi:branched-chain amino acid transport system permease protein